MVPQWGHNGDKGAKTYNIYTQVEKMQNIEKTIRSILKKFEVPSKYDARKIVFWYDEDETADDGDLRISNPRLP